MTLSPRPVWPEIGDGLGALVHWRTYAALLEEPNGISTVLFSANGCEECTVESLKTFSQQLEELRESRDMAISLEGFKDACELRLRMVDARLGSVLVEVSINDPPPTLATPDDLFQLCKEYDFPGCLRISFLTDQSYVAIMNSQIRSFLRLLSSLKECP